MPDQPRLTQEEAERALDQASIAVLADPYNLFKQEVWLAAHKTLADVMEPAPIPSIADNHPMRNHPAFKAIQKRLAEEADK